MVYSLFPMINRLITPGSSGTCLSHFLLHSPGSITVGAAFQRIQTRDSTLPSTIFLLLWYEVWVNLFEITLV